jgi:hypothetical protein
LELGVEDRVGVAGFVAAGVADWCWRSGSVQPAVVGDQLAVVADEQPADDVPDGAQLGFAGLDQAGADVVPKPEVASSRLSMAVASLDAALLVLGGGVPELVVFDSRTCEVRLLAGDGLVVVVELFVDEVVEHEGGIDDPDTGGEVLAAVVHERAAADARAVANLPRDAELERS